MSWIKVTDGTPVPNHIYLVTFETMDGGRFSTVAYYREPLEWEMMHGASEYQMDMSLFEDYNMVITHFMEIPEPFQSATQLK